MWTFSITGPVCQSSSEPKILLYSLNISSTIWFWYSMWTAMFPVSFSGLRSVGPNTIPKLCVDIRFTDSLAAILLTKGKNWLKTSGVKGVAVAFEVHRGIFLLILRAGMFVWLSYRKERKEGGKRQLLPAGQTRKGKSARGSKIRSGWRSRAPFTVLCQGTICCFLVSELVCLL